ncbi:hypothetical protein PCANB_002227 [Pneumocystis canis]|nr:hypothetical protein PCK1_002350 [Pneumocystis canis]KAG5438897.1 hypothetical protein PCANB_002227 [Pneumocystis canis]
MSTHTVNLSSFKNNNETTDTHSATQEAADQEAARHTMLSHILEPAARDRLTRISLVHADRARAIEDMLLRMARQGTLYQKVTESALITLLNEISGEETRKNETKIIYQRRVSDDDLDTI